MGRGCPGAARSSTRSTIPLSQGYTPPFRESDAIILAELSENSSETAPMEAAATPIPEPRLATAAMTAPAQAARHSRRNKIAPEPQRDAPPRMATADTGRRFRRPRPVGGSDEREHMGGLQIVEPFGPQRPELRQRRVVARRTRTRRSRPQGTHTGRRRVSSTHAPPFSGLAGETLKDSHNESLDSFTARAQVDRRTIIANDKTS